MICDSVKRFTGLAHVTECVVHKNEGPGSRYGLLVNGSDFASVLALPGIDGTRTHFNSAVAVASVLGIEAARVTIISEIEMTMRNHGIELDRRHVMLLADLMTYRFALFALLPLYWAYFIDSFQRGSSGHNSQWTCQDEGVSALDGLVRADDGNIYLTLFLVLPC